MVSSIVSTHIATSNVEWLWDLNEQYTRWHMDEEGRKKGKEHVPNGRAGKCN